MASPLVLAVDESETLDVFFEASVVVCCVCLFTGFAVFRVNRPSQKALKLDSSDDQEQTSGCTSVSVFAGLAAVASRAQAFFVSVHKVISNCSPSPCDSLHDEADSSEELLEGMNSIDDVMNGLMEKHLESLAETCETAASEFEEELLEGLNSIDDVMDGLMEKHLESLQDQFDAVPEPCSYDNQDMKDIVKGLDEIDDTMGSLMEKHLDQLEASEIRKHSCASSTACSDDSDNAACSDDEEELINGLNVIDSAVNDLMTSHLMALSQEAVA